MRTNVAVFFGGRSVEHEISVISASQAMHAINREKYNVIPVYISKQGKWYTGEKLFDIANYRDMNTLVKNCEEVFMRPEFGDYNLYRAKTNNRDSLCRMQHRFVGKRHGQNHDENDSKRMRHPRCRLRVVYRQAMVQAKRCANRKN